MHENPALVQGSFADPCPQVMTCFCLVTLARVGSKGQEAEL